MIVRNPFAALLALAVLTGGLAGCIAPPEDAQAAAAPDAEPEPHDSGDMTAEERTDESEGLNDGLVPPFVAERVTTVEGDLTLPRLPIDLRATNGKVHVTAGDEGRWRLVATLRGYGMTPVDARQNLDRLTFEWSHEAPDGYHLMAVVKEDDADRTGSVNVGPATDALLHLELPPGLVADLDATATNGKVVVEDLAARSLVVRNTNGDLLLRNVHATDVVARTTNGNVDAALADTARVHLESTNGDVRAAIEPAKDGAIQATSTNGGVEVLVPETDRYGYAVNAATTNGDADVSLKDGTARSERNVATFRTTGFEDRDVRVDVTARSTNGNVRVAPS